MFYIESGKEMHFTKSNKNAVLSLIIFIHYSQSQR